jgi:hypothetical protein
MNEREETYVEREVVRAGVWQLMRRLPTWAVTLITVAVVGLLLFSKH